MKKASGLSVYFAMGGNIVIAISKFIAAGVTGSSAMISEGIHSLVDTADGVLLLLGKSRSQRPPSEEHPFGYGLELYFWTLIVAIMIFALGGGMSIYEGINHLRHPVALENPKINYIVLLISMAAEGSSFFVAFREFKVQKKYPGIWTSIRRGKDPTVFTVLFEDGAALIGLTIALVATIVEEATQWLAIDGIASILIGLVLVVVAFLLTRESKGLLLGEGVRPAVQEKILEILRSSPAFEGTCDLRSMHFGPTSVLVIIKATLNPKKLNRSVDEEKDFLKKEIQRQFPGIEFIYFEPVLSSGG